MRLETLLGYIQLKVHSVYPWARMELNKDYEYKSGIIRLEMSPQLNAIEVHFQGLRSDFEELKKSFIPYFNVWVGGSSKYGKSVY